eukprot:1158162-Pelagomonas_calceolata.AAC.4
MAVPAFSKRAPGLPPLYWTTSSLKQPVTNLSATQLGSASSQAPRVMSSSIPLSSATVCPSTAASSRTSGRLCVLAAAPSTIPQSATHLPTSAVGTSSAPTPQRTAALPSTITSTKRSSFSSAGPTIAVEAAQQQDAAVPSSTTEASTSQGTIAQLKSTSSSRTTAHPQQQQQQQQKEERDQVEARLAAALVWCARQLAGRYKEMGDTEGEALAYLERHGVRCTAHYQNNSRFFSFPGCTSWLTKEALVPAIEEQVRRGTDGEETVAPGARRTEAPCCAYCCSHKAGSTSPPLYLTTTLRSYNLREIV